jgi:hypothetical protein
MLLIIYFALSSLSAFIFSQFDTFIPQIIALASIILIIVSIKTKQLNIYLLSFLLTTIVLSTGGLNSPAFFLIYFLLFIIAFQSQPSITLSCSLITIIFLSTTLENINSIIILSSLLLITPLVWFVGQQFIQKQKTENCLSVDETDFQFWIKLKFKTGITKIIDSASILLSQPQLTPTQKEEVKFIKDSAKNLLNSSNKLSDRIEHSKDEL